MIIDDGGIFSTGAQPPPPSSGRLRQSALGLPSAGSGPRTKRGPTMRGPTMRASRRSVERALPLLRPSAVAGQGACSASSVDFLAAPNASGGVGGRFDSSARPSGRYVPPVGLEDLPDPDGGPGAPTLDDELGGPEMRAYALRTSMRGGVRLVGGRARRVIHSAVYAERENGVGAWLRALDTESRRALAPLGQASWDRAMAELNAAASGIPSSSDDEEEEEKDGGASGRRALPRDARAVERWLVANGVLESEKAGGSRGHSRQGGERARTTSNNAHTGTAPTQAAMSSDASALNLETLTLDERLARLSGAATGASGAAAAAAAACAVAHPPNASAGVAAAADVRQAAAAAEGAAAEWPRDEEEADDGADPTLALPPRLQPNARAFASRHFALSSRGRRALESLGRELMSESRQQDFAAAVASVARNRMHVPGGGAGGGHEPVVAARRRKRRSSADQSRVRDASWEDSVAKVAAYLQLEAEARRQGHTTAAAARAAKAAAAAEQRAQQPAPGLLAPPAAAHAAAAALSDYSPRTAADAADAAAEAALPAHERLALRAKMTKHRELIRRVFYYYRAQDGLAPELPAGGRLPPSLGGPAAEEMHGLPPLLPVDDSPVVAANGDGYVRRPGEPQDPESTRIGLAQLWRLLKEVRVLGGGLTSAEVDALWAEGGLLQNVEQEQREKAAAAEEASGGQLRRSSTASSTAAQQRGAAPRQQRASAASSNGNISRGGGFDPMAGLVMPAADSPLASASVIGFSEALVLLAHARFGGARGARGGRRVPTLSAAFDKLCSEHLEEFACQGDGCIDWLRRALSLRPLAELLSRRQETLRWLYIYWARAHYGGNSTRKSAGQAALGTSVDKVLGPRSVAVPVTVVGERGMAREAREAEAERRREEVAAQRGADLLLLLQIGGAADMALPENGFDKLGGEGPDGWEYAGAGSGDGMNFNHFLVLLAETGLLAARPSPNAQALSAAEAVRVFEQTTGVRGVLPRVCRSNADIECTYSEWLELLARLVAQMSRKSRGHLLGGREARAGAGGKGAETDEHAARAGAEEEGAPLAALLDSLIENVLVPHTERRLAALVLGATASTVT